MLKMTASLARIGCSIGLLTALVQCGGGGGDSTAQTAPVIAIQPQSQKVTAPAAVTFVVTATGNPAPTSYVWSLNGKVVGTTSALTIPQTSVDMNGNSYTVVVSNGVGAPVVSDPAVLTVLAAPEIVTQPAGVTLALGAAATFSVTATGNPAVSYQWRRNGVDIPGAVASSYTTAAVGPGDNGDSYTVALSNGIGGPVLSGSAILVVGQAPAITSQPVAQTVLAPAPATFTVTATGNPLAYQWQDETGANIPGATSPSYTTPATTAAFNGKSYRVVVSGFGAPVTSGAASLTVTTGASITTQPVSQILNPGSALNLSVAAVGAPAVFTYRWFHNGALIPGANAATYSVAAAATADSGTYYVDVSNGSGDTAQSTTVTVTVAQLYTVSGNVSLGSGPAAGVTLTINTTPPATATTDSAGNYALTSVYGGVWTVTPTLAGVTSVFYPASQQVTVTTGNQTADFRAAAGYTVSGVVNYPGANTGPIYLSMTGGNDQVPGTTLQTAGPFSIRGVPPGTYTLNGVMDLSGGAVLNANDPAGTLASMTVAGADVTGLVLGLADQAVDLTGQAGPAEVNVSPMASGAVAVFRAITKRDSLPLAQSYTVDWSPSSTFTPVVSQSFPARSTLDGLYTCLIGFDPTLPALVDGTSLYFRVRGQAGSTFSNATRAPGPVTIGAPTGPNTVSGTFNFTGGATGPLYVGIFDFTTLDAYLTAIPAPGNAQPFSVSGVPAGGTYYAVGFVDQNRNGQFDISDLGAETSDLVSVAGNVAGLALTAPSANATMVLTTNHVRVDAGADSYQLVFHLKDAIKHIDSATLASGPRVLVPVDYANPTGDQDFDLVANLGARPQVGDRYGVVVNYSDGTRETLNAQVTGVLDTFAQGLAPSTSLGTAALGTNVAPIFRWAAPTTPPATFDYQFSIQTLGGPRIFQRASGLRLVAWNATGAAPLTPGTPYVWSVKVRDDATGNTAEQKTTYTP